MAPVIKILKAPVHPLEDGNGLYIPSGHEIWHEFFQNLNMAKDRKNWINLTNWPVTAVLGIFAAVYFVYFFSWPTLGLALFYAMVVMNVHGTLYLHRYGAHGAFRFSHHLWRLLVQNFCVKVFAEETFILSHQVHHANPDTPMDPHNPKLGRLYIMLADTLRAQINPVLTEEEYARVSSLIRPSIMRVNTYPEFKRWGSLAHPGMTIANYLLNWVLQFSFYAYFFSLHVAFSVFAGAFFWAISVRYFNYKSHGGGRKLFRLGREIHENDLSLNNYLAGFLAGEWHNSHHLHPSSAQAGVLPWQVDLTYQVINLLGKCGIVHSVKVASFGKANFETFKNT